MSQLCRVCGEPAAGFHFGAFTCEGCKSFFGRTYNNLSSISECKNNGECVINKKNRTSCKACRLRKCLVVGMSKSGSRYGRRSNWFKIHCLLQEQQQHHQQQHQHQHQHQHQQQHSAHHQHHQPVGGAGLHFQQQPVTGVRPSSLEPGRTPPPPWADVKRHLRLDADNNNSVVGDLNKDVAGVGGRLSVSAAAAAAAVVQAVRPELLRWPSPFFPAFPFPPPAPFFLALQPPPPLGRRSSPNSPASRSSAAEDDHERPPPPRSSSPPPPLVRLAATDCRDLPPVQESPMDLSVSATAASLPLRPSTRSPSPAYDGDGGCSGGLGSSGSSADGLHRDQRRRHRRRRRRRRRRQSDGTGGDRTSSSESDSDSHSDGSAVSGGRRPVKNVPLDLTFNRINDV